MNTLMKLINTKRFKEALEEAEKEIYEKAYEYTGGNQSATARLLGVSRMTAINKMKIWRIMKNT